MYLAMLAIFAEAGRPRMWPSWWVAVPLAALALTLLFMAIPIRIIQKGSHEMDEPVVPTTVVIGGAARVSNVRVDGVQSSGTTRAVDISGIELRNVHVENIDHETR